MKIYQMHKHISNATHRNTKADFNAKNKCRQVLTKTVPFYRSKYIVNIPNISSEQQ